MASLYIRAYEGGPSWEVWPSPAAIPSGAVQENRHYLFELRNADDASGADLLIDEVALVALRSRERRTALWRWSTDFHAGKVEAVLRLPGAVPRRFDIITDPDLGKLTQADFDTMVREILADTFALFSLSAFRRGIARGTGSRPPAIARLEFLRSRVGELALAVEQITRNPRRFLRGEDAAVPYWQAVHATGPEILRSFRSGRIWQETARPPRLPPVLKGLLPETIRLRRHVNSVDIPEHRQIKACLRSWGAWLGNVADILDRSANTEPDAGVRSHFTTWAIRTHRLARQLARLVALPFFADVSDAPARVMLSAIFRNDPAYRRFYRLHQDMNLGLAAVFGDFLQMPLARTFELYELWCFLRLVRAAVETYGPAGLDLTSLFLRSAAGGITVAASAVTVPVGGGYTLCFQRQYREFWAAEDGRGSFSRTMTPDFVVSYGAGGGSAQRLIILDAKYRIGESLNDAIGSIHMYRDALVQETVSGEIEGIVTAAYLLTPHVPRLEPTYRCTPLPGRLFHRDYRGKFRFGAITLRPGMNMEEIGLALRAILAEADLGK